MINNLIYKYKDIRAYYDFYNVDKSLLFLDVDIVVVVDVLNEAYY
jgi:hypothetical protein